MKTPTAEWVTITPDVAADYLAYNEGNRKVGPKHITMLSADMKAGNYLVTGDTIKFDRNGRLIDGQHRLRAIIASGIPQVMLVVRGLDPLVQTVIDAQKRRSAADALGFALDAMNATTLAAIARLDMSIQVTKNPTAISGAKSSNATNPEVIEWVSNNLDAMDVTSRAKGLALKNSDIRLPASFAGWLWLQFSRAAGMDKADEFFAPMTDRHQPFGSDTVEPRFDPRFTYMQAVNRFTLDDRASLKPVVFGVRAWNTWRHGKELRTLRTMSGGANHEGLPMPLELPR